MNLSTRLAVGFTAAVAMISLVGVSSAQELNFGVPASLGVGVTGICPGPVLIEVTGATPGGDVGFVHAAEPGSFVLGGLICLGTEAGLEAPKLLAIQQADGSGTVQISANLPEAACGRILRAMDLTTCGLTPIFAPCQVATEYWPDEDEDFYGDSSYEATLYCAVPPPGWADNPFDCDDTNPDVHPSAEELCDGLDNDCDAVTDDFPIDCTFGPDSCCNATCVDTQSDPQNCGSCGNTCPIGETCLGGGCVPE